jgi:hypothetical protein
MFLQSHLFDNGILHGIAPGPMYAYNPLFKSRHEGSLNRHSFNSKEGSWIV